MLCERCENREATVHLTEINKGVKSEVHLCEECARTIGLNSKLSNFSLAIPDFLSFLNEDTKEYHDQPEVVICKNCGLDIQTANKTRKVNCPYCYYFFSEKISALLGGSDIRHTGRVPDNYTDFTVHGTEHKPERSSLNDVSILKSRLDQAVENEEYEEAALLRDKIKDLEQLCRGN